VETIFRQRTYLMYKSLPDFSERGKSLAKKSWIRPQKTVFWDLDNLLRRSNNVWKQTLHRKGHSVYYYHKFLNQFVQCFPKAMVLKMRVETIVTKKYYKLGTKQVHHGEDIFYWIFLIFIKFAPRKGTILFKVNDEF
jgi:hypothetical protein